MTAANRLLGRVLLSAGLLLLPVQARAGDRDFNRIVDRLAEHYHQRPRSGFGFLSFLARCFMPHAAGISHLRMAIFEQATAPGNESLDGFIEPILEPRFQPFVKVRSASGERTCIYLREDHQHIELLLVNLEPHEAVVMKMRLDPERFSQWLADPEAMGRTVAQPKR